MGKTLLLALIVFSLAASKPKPTPPLFKVIGVVHSSIPDKTIVMMRNLKTGLAYGFKLYDKVDEDCWLVGIQTRYVSFYYKNADHLVRIGDELVFDPEFKPKPILEADEAELISEDTTEVFGPETEEEANYQTYYEDEEDEDEEDYLANSFHSNQNYTLYPPYINKMGYHMPTVKGGSLLERLGFQQNDTVTEINGFELNGDIDFLHSLAGDSLQVRYIRAGKFRSMKIGVR